MWPGRWQAPLFSKHSHKALSKMSDSKARRIMPPPLLAASLCNANWTHMDRKQPRWTVSWKKPGRNFASWIFWGGVKRRAATRGDMIENTLKRERVQCLSNIYCRVCHTSSASSAAWQHSHLSFFLQLRSLWKVNFHRIFCRSLWMKSYNRKIKTSLG